MRTGTPLLVLFAGVLSGAISLPAVAHASPSGVFDSERAPSRRVPDAEIPHDGRPIVATVVDIDTQAMTVTLETPHGPVSLAVSQEVVDTLSVGDVVVVRFTEEEEGETDYPAGSPRTEPRRI